MTPEELARLYPVLYHVAEPGSWPSIRERGLLTSEQLCLLFEPPDAEELLTVRRPSKVLLRHPVHGTATLRDQKPLSEAKLASCLTDGTTVADWLAMLNGRVFFWLQAARRDRMLSAYRGDAHDLLTVDTASLLRVHTERVRLSRINSGSTAYVPRSRGRGTFLPVSEYPHPHRRRALASASDVAELCVVGGVHDLRSHAVLVERIEPDGARTELWRPERRPTDPLGMPE